MINLDQGQRQLDVIKNLMSEQPQLFETEDQVWPMI